MMYISEIPLSDLLLYKLSNYNLVEVTKFLILDRFSGALPFHSPPNYYFYYKYGCFYIYYSINTEFEWNEDLKHKIICLTQSFMYPSHNTKFSKGLLKTVTETINENLINIEIDKHKMDRSKDMTFLLKNK